MELSMDKNGGLLQKGETNLRGHMILFFHTWECFVCPKFIWWSFKIHKNATINEWPSILL